MEKEKTPSIKETMGTRETDDALFADEIIKDIDEPKEEPKTPAIGSLEGTIEPPSSPAILEKPQAEHIEEAEHIKELQEINGAESSASKAVEESIIEPTPAPYVNIKKIQDLVDTDSKNVSDLEEDKPVAPPTLVVEKAEPEPKEEKSSVEPTTNGHDSDHLRTADTSQETRNGARTPELADVAAEVADVAATLDRDQPTPPISDEEAGRIGFRRMSSTPIPQVAVTAAEVADSAAVIDKEEDKPEEFIRPFDIDDGPLPETPPNEKVPLFSHECCSPPDHQEPRQPEDFDPYEGMRPRVEIEEPIDLSDPNIKHFPTDRAGIMEHLREMQERLPEDEVKLDLAPRSPVIDPNNPRADRRGSRDLPAVSPVVLAQRSPSLDSIAEDNDESSNVLAAAPVKLNGEDKSATNGINVTKHEIAAVTSDELPVGKENEAPLLEPEGKLRHLGGSVDGSDESGLNARLEQLEVENTETDEPVTEHLVKEPVDKVAKKDVSEGQDAEPTKSTEESTDGAAEVIPEQNDSAKSTAVESGTDDTQVKSRKRQPSPARSPERPVTPTSMKSPGRDVQNDKERNIFKAFFRVVFVEWIGGFFLRLCGGRRRRQVLMAGVATLVAGSALYYFDLIPPAWESNLQHLHIPLK
jgi:hypothetical protein